VKNPESMKKLTLWKIKMEPENDDLEDHFPFQMGDLEVPCESSVVYKN